MSEYFEYEPETLIEEVKKRPGLWDAEHKDYKIRPIRVKLWDEIVTAIMGDAELSRADRRGLEIQVQKRWRCYRDSFIRYVTRPEKYKNKPYTHHERLQFLMKCVEINKSAKRPRSEEAATSESEEDVKPKTGWRKTKIKRSKDSNDEEEFDQPGEYVDTFVEGQRMTNANNPYGEESFGFANVDPQLPIRYELEDPDKMFLLSLLPHLKTVPDRHRLNVKMDLMKVLRNAQ